MKKMIVLVIAIGIIISSCKKNKTYYCHCSNEIGQDLTNNKDKSQAESECNSYETEATGDCYITTDFLD